MIGAKRSILAMVVAVGIGGIAAGSEEWSAYYVDDDAQECLNCPDSVTAEEVLAAVRQRDAIDIGSWLREFAAPRDGVHALTFEKSPISETYTELISNWPHGAGVSFRNCGCRLDYWIKPCKIFDCYRFFMALRASDGSVVWQRRVPPLKQPVFPLFTDWGIAFVGWKDDGSHLVILDPESGTTRAEVRIPGEAVAFDSANPLETFPFVAGRYVVLRGCRSERGDSGFVTERVANGFLVIPINLDPMETPTHRSPSRTSSQ